MWLEVGFHRVVECRARYRGNELIDGKVEAIASTRGTCITVDDLFYSIPSRQNMYLGKESEETKQILSLLQIFSIHYGPQGVMFTLKECPNKALFKSYKATTIEESISNVIGASIKPTLKRIRIDAEKNVECPFEADLVLSPKSPVVISPSLSFILFVNGRYITNTRIKQGIKRVLEQYYYCSDTNSKSRNQNQFCYVSIQIDSHLVDVNIHPNKREICFLDEDYVVQRITERVEAEIDHAINTETIGNVTPSKRNIHTTPTQTSSKKVRIDYSQRTLQFLPQESIPLQEDSIIDRTSLDPLQSSPTTSATKPSSILSDVVNVTPFKTTRDDLQLDSVCSLCEDIRRLGANCSHERDIFQKSIFISCLDDPSTSLIQYENRLYLCHLSFILCAITRPFTRREEYFYQLILFNFGCFYKIQFLDQALDIQTLVSAAASKKGEECSTSVLCEFAMMLNDYFSISIEKNEQGVWVLRSLPLLVSGYEPYYGYLPVFLYNLCSCVHYNDEKRCLDEISLELARFYSFIPRCKEAAEREAWESVIQAVLYPQAKKQMIVCDRLWSCGAIQEIASTERLYRVFERCFCVCLKTNP